MSQVHTIPAALPAQSRTAVYTSTKAASIPWTIWFIIAGITSGAIGGLWDISWHMSIGRDTFWTPAHIVIYMGGLIPGLTSGWLIFKTTFFGTSEERAGSVRIWGAYGPLGAWVVVWGAIAMLTAAPFDNWWHNAYGLDVKIISPPHTVLAVGIDMVALGVLLRVLALQNQMSALGLNRGAGLFVFMAGVRIAMLSVFLTEESF